jgi:hypothetical protein
MPAPCPIMPPPIWAKAYDANAIRKNTSGVTSVFFLIFIADPQLFDLKKQTSKVSAITSALRLSFGSGYTKIAFIK